MHHIEDIFLIVLLSAGKKRIMDFYNISDYNSFAIKSSPIKTRFQM